MLAARLGLSYETVVEGIERMAEKIDMIERMATSIDLALDEGVLEGQHNGEVMLTSSGQITMTLPVVGWNESPMQVFPEPIVK